MNHWQAHWSLFLAQFNFSLIHWPGQHSTKLDALSQSANYLTEEEDNHDQVMLSANRLSKLSKPSESLVANSDDPSDATLEGKEASILEYVHNCTD